MYELFVVLAVLLSSTNARFKPSSPARTEAVLIPDVDAPKPTGYANLLVRAQFGDKVCGYENGNLQLPLGCLPNYDCTHDGAASVSGCCATTGSAAKCELDTTCIDYTSNAGGSAVIPRAYRCDEAQPYCTTAYFIDNYAMFTCGDGQGISRVSAFYHATSAEVATSISSQGQSSGPPKSSSGNSDSAGNGSSTPIGPIVGGVVGGFGVVIIGAILIWRTKRKQKKPSPSSDSVVEMTKPPTGESSMSKHDPWSAGKVQEVSGHGYSEMEVPPTELPLPDRQYAHEAPTKSAAPRSLGRSELGGGEAKTYAELDGQSRQQ